jgi:hypothetical protein
MVRNVMSKRVGDDSWAAWLRKYAIARGLNVQPGMSIERVCADINALLEADEMVP